MFKWLFISLLFVGPTFAATLNVPGTYSTIQAACNAYNPGDIVRVAAGTYNERVSLSRSGSVGNFVNIVADGWTNVICRGFDANSISFVRIIGFEITHTNTDYNNGIVLTTCTNVQTIHNYIHNLHATGAMITSGGALGYIVHRGNIIQDAQIVDGVAVGDPSAGISMYPNQTDHSLLEYNIIKRVGDFIYMHGTYGLARNNALTQYTNEYWNFSPGTSFHIDGFQDGSDGIATGMKFHFYDNNWHGQSSSQDSHAGLWQNTIAADDQHVVYRGTMNYYVGAGGIANISTRDFYTYNCTYTDPDYAVAGAGNGSVINMRSVGGRLPTNGFVMNTLVYDNGSRNGAIDVSDTFNVTKSNNHGYLAGTDTSYIATTDPLLVDKAGTNFHLQASSPLRNTGTNVTTVTSATSSGTSFDVGNGKLFCDGFGIAEGDLIRVGSTNGTLTRITGISSNTITVATSISWTNGDPVYWENYGKDIGAFPYFATELTAASISNVGTTYTATTTGDCRMVIFYVDGIPHTTDYDSPYTATITSGTVTAVAYARYAQAIPFVLATSGGGGGGGGQTSNNIILTSPTTIRTSTRL